MAVDSLDPVTGAPRFLDDGAPDLAVDQNAVADFAAEVGNRYKGTTAQRNAHPHASREGVAWYDTTLGYELTHDGTGWKPTNEIHLTGGKDGPPPAKAHLIQKFHYVAGQTTAAGLLAFTWPTPFPNSAAAAFFTTATGTSVAAQLNANTLSKGGATVIFPGVGTTNVSFYVQGIGW